MGLMLTGVSKPSNGVAMSAASSLRADITTLYRRADLAPAVLIVAFIFGRAIFPREIQTSAASAHRQS